MKQQLTMGLALATCLFSGAVSAQAIYRCGDTSFSDAPCTGARLVRTVTVTPEAQEAAQRSREYWAGLQASVAQREAAREPERRSGATVVVMPNPQSALPERPAPSTWGGSPTIMQVTR